MQKLALMMAVMILGMSPAHGCSISAESRDQGVGGQAEMMPLLPTWSGRILQQIQLGVEGLNRIGNEIMRIGQDEAKEVPGEEEGGPDSKEEGQDYKPEGGTVPKAAEALKKGADVARGRGQRKSRWYQRTGTKN